jgi:hypothetical protein
MQQVQKFPLERLIRKNHRDNWQACTDELTDLRHTIEEAPIKFQWNQVCTRLREKPSSRVEDQSSPF